MGSKSRWTGGNIPGGDSLDGLSPSKPASDWPPAPGNGLDAGDQLPQAQVDGPTGKATPNTTPPKQSLT